MGVPAVAYLAEAWELGFAAGVQHTRGQIGEIIADVLTHAAEAQERALAVGRITSAQRRAARIAEWEQCAARLHAELGRPRGWTYRGGPVDWETGLPVGSACAWLRRQRSGSAERGAA